MSNFELLRQKAYDANALGCAIAIMEWDQQTMMPVGGAAARAEHIGILSRMAHEAATSDEIGRLLEDSVGELETEFDHQLHRVMKRGYDLRTKLPVKLVEEKARLSSEAHEGWVAARKNNDFASFAPILNRMFEIAQEEAACLGYTDHIYDALLDQYEEGATKADCDRMFDGIRGPQVALMKEIVEAGLPDDSFLYGDWDLAAQKEFTEKAVKSIGFDFERGRQDTAPHPFCTGWSIGDVRLTTRYKKYLGSAIFGSLHEAGHGMYEQGSPMAWDRLPICGGVSLGVHESQSRTWENIVGRSEAFWTHFLPQLKEKFPALAHQELKPFLRAINRVEPTLIRVEADEVTYNLHVMVRFEVECAVLEGRLAVKDMPEFWNEKYREYLGIVPPSDAEGCLQDVHWSMGAIGYFPTYSMGNLLSAQIWNCLVRDLGDVDAMMAGGNFAPILTWLQEKIYSKGSSLTPKDLILQVTGKPMGPEDYLEMLSAKYRRLFELN